MPGTALERAQHGVRGVTKAMSVRIIMFRMGRYYHDDPSVELSSAKNRAWTPIVSNS